MSGKTQFSLTNNPQMTDFQGTETTNGLFDDGSGYGINSASEDSSGFFDNLLDPTGFVKGFYNDLMGFTSQEREFEQQMKMTQYENKWNSAQEQMKRAKEAGINPLTAAAGISGGGTGQVASPGGSATPSSAAADTISKLGGLHSDVAAKSAAAELDSVNADIAPRVADAEILAKAAAAARDLTKSGITEIAACEIGLGLACNGLKGFSNAFNGDNECRMFDFEMNKLESEINTENARFQDYMTHSQVNVTQSELNDIRAQHESVLKQLADEKLLLTKKYKAMAADGEFLQQFLIAEQFGIDSREYQALMNFYKDKFYNQGIGQYSADMDTAAERAFNEAFGRNEADIKFEPLRKSIELTKDEILEAYKSLLQNPRDPLAFFGKLSNIFVHMTSLLGGKMDMDSLHFYQYPKMQPKRSEFVR